MRERDAEALLDRLAPKAADVVVEDAGNDVLKASFLVAREGSIVFDRELEDASRERGAETPDRGRRAAPADRICVSGARSMGLLTALLTLPLAPVRGTVWVAEVLLEEAERQMRDPAFVEQQLVEAEAAHERGELSDDQFAEIEDELLGRLLSGGGA